MRRREVAKIRGERVEPLSILIGGSRLFLDINSGEVGRMGVNEPAFEFGFIAPLREDEDFFLWREEGALL